MPRFRIRLDDPESREFRVYRVPADTEEQAVAIVMHREQRAVDWRMPADELAALEAREDGDGEPLTKSESGRLHSHRQARPYEVTTVTELTDGQGD